MEPGPITKLLPGAHLPDFMELNKGPHGLVGDELLSTLSYTQASSYSIAISMANVLSGFMRQFLAFTSRTCVMMSSGTNYLHPRYTELAEISHASLHVTHFFYLKKMMINFKILLGRERKGQRKELS